MTTPWHYAQIQARRDETFERVRRVFRWTVVAALAGAAVITGVVAREIPGRSTVATTSNSGSGAPATTPASSPATSGGVAGGGAPPPQVTPPAPTQSPPTAVSGGTGF